MPLNYVDICIALYDYTAQTDDELTFHEDDVLYILENDDEDWWKAKLKIANTEGAESSEEQSIGLVPRNYIQAAECTAVLKALWDYEANSEEELSFKEDDMLNLYEEDEDGWYLVKFNNLFGMIPPNYVEKVSMDSVEQDTQEENYEDEGESENQINKSKTVSCFDAVSSPSDQNNTYVDPLKLYAVKAARPKAGSSASESKTWSVTEVVGDKKKQKKKGTLVIGNGRVIFASGSDKAPVRQWEINDIIDIKKDKKNKNISFTFGGSKGGTIEFQAHKNIIMEIHQKSEDCRASLEIPTVKVNSASIRSSISSPTLSTSSRPSSTHKSIESEEPQNEDIDQYEEQDSRSSSHQNLPEEEEEEEEEEAELTSPKFGVALYDFDAQGDDEVSIREGDELWIIDDFSSEEWWKVRKDDEEGVVPASFIELRSEEDNEAEKAAQAAAQAAAEAAAAEAAAEAERRLEEEERIKREEEKRRRQREEEDRKRREAEKRVQEEKKRKAATQSQPPPPPPVLSNRPVRANPSLDEEAVRKIQTPANRALPERPLQAQSKSKPIPSNTRTWTDRTGTFKVEAQFLQLVDGKVHLHKLNGVKISVPVDKMSKEDLAYLEEITGEKVYDKNDDTPLAAIAAAYKGKARYVDYNWYDFFLNAGVSHEDAFEYAKMFLAEKMDESSISDLDRDVMKGLGIKEGDIIRIKKYIDQKYNSGKKRTVSFGTTSVIPDDIDRQSRNKQSARKTQSEDAKKAQQFSEFDIKMQMKRDEQFARELQEEENRIARSEGRQIPKAAELYGNLDSIIQREEKKTPTTTTPQLFSANNGVLKNNTKKARPQPTKSASIQIDAKTLVDAKGSFNEAFKSSSLATSAENKFDDDAWASKDLTPPLVPTVKAPTPPPPPPPPPPSSISQTPPSVPVRPSNLLSSSNLSLNSSTPVNQNQISPRLPLVTQSLSTNPNSGSNTTGQFSMNWNSNNMNIQSSQLVSPPIPPPPPQQPIVIPLNNTLHPPLIPSKPFPNNTNNNMNIVNNTQGNNVFSTMNIQRSNSTGNFQGMSTNNLNNLSGPGGNFDSSTSAWNSTSLTSNSTSGYSLPNQFNSNTNQLQQLQIQQTTIQLQQLQLQSSSNQSQQLQSQQSSKYDPQNVFASMKAGQFGPIAPTSNLGANSSQDRYSVFKQVDPNAPSIFNNPNSAINPPSGVGFGQGGFVNSNPANWNQNNFRGTSVPQQTSNFGIQQNPGFGFSGQSNQLNSQGFNPNQGLNNLGLNNQGFNTNPGFNNNNQQNPGGFNKQW